MFANPLVVYLGGILNHWFGRSRDSFGLAWFATSLRRLMTIEWRKRCLLLARICRTRMSAPRSRSGVKPDTTRTAQSSRERPGTNMRPPASRFQVCLWAELCLSRGWIIATLPHSGRHVLRKYDRRSAARLSLILGERFFHAAIVVEMDV